MALGEAAGLPVALWDERLSSSAVNRAMIEADMTRAKRAAAVDAAAAAYTLQSALDATRPPASPAADPRRPPAPLPGGTAWPPSRRGLACPRRSPRVPMSFSFPILPGGHLLAIEGLEPPHIGALLDLAESYALLNRCGKTQRDLLRGRTLINLFFENTTRTRTSFELAGKRLGADVVNMSPRTSAMSKGETLIDTAVTLNAMHRTCWWSATPRPARPPCCRRRSTAA